MTRSIPIPFLSWYEARRTCDKFLINSMAGPFTEFSDWAELHGELNQSPAMLSQCESGGRYLHWLGYRSGHYQFLLHYHQPHSSLLSSRSELKPNSSEDFLHILGNESLTVNGWRPKQPNARQGDQCLCSYLGLEPNASWW